MSDRIPPNWLEIYDLVSDHLGKVTFAGGALRDWDNGREVKDLDFFYSEAQQESLLRLIPELRATHHIPRNRPIMGQADEDNTSWDGADTVSTLYLPSLDASLPDINLVGVVNPMIEVQLDRFDFGTCRIGWDGNQLIRTEEYLDDQRSRTFTICADRKDDQLIRTYQRFERISQRYRGWTLVDPAAVARQFAGVDERVEVERNELEVEFEF